jgi:hypothetical protein
MKIKRKLLYMSSTHYYFGRSPIKLAIQQFLRFLAFLKTPAPSADLLATMSSIKNTKNGMTALVIGNGPSQELLIAEKVNQYFDDVFVVNDFHKMPAAKEIKAAYYGLSDPISFRKEIPEIAQDLVSLENYAEKTGCAFLLPHLKEIEFSHLSNMKYFFDDRELIFLKKISPMKPRPYTSVTLYKVLSVAMHLGYSNIYIIGLDNTEFYNYRGDISNHLYNQAADMSLVFESGIAGRMQSYAHLFGDLSKFPTDKIINLDPKSLTDAFPKIESHPVLRNQNVQD